MKGFLRICMMPFAFFHRVHRVTNILNHGVLIPEKQQLVDPFVKKRKWTAASTRKRIRPLEAAGHVQLHSMLC